jgi:PAS domain S-box-containing protein
MDNGERVAGLSDQISSGIDGLDIGFALFDSDLRLLMCNQQLSELHGYPDSFRQPGTALSVFLGYDTSGTEIDQLLHSLAADNVFKSQITSPQDQILSVRYARLVDGGVLLTSTNITEQRETERALQQSQERSALVTEAATEGLYEWNVESNVLYVSPRLNQMFEFEKDSLTPHEWNERIVEEDRAAYVELMRAHFKGRDDRMKATYRIRDKNGDIRWVEDSAIAVRDADNRATRLVGAVSDISEQKESEEALQQSEERHNLALEALGEWIYDWDTSSDEVYYSDGIYKSLGLKRDELRNTADWLERLHPDDKIIYRAAFSDLFKKKATDFSIEYRFRGSEGEWRWASQHGVAVTNNKGEIIRVTGSTGDITERKSLSGQLEQAQERLIESERLASLGQVTAGVAHEIKNPLNFVNNFAELSVGLVEELNDLVTPLLNQLEEDDREDAKDIVAMLQGNMEKIQQHGKRADGIVQSMLDHSRESDVEIQDVDINSLVSEALNLAYHGARSNNSEFNVTLEQDLDEKAGTLAGQPQDLMRVFLNLAGNAIHATNKRREEGGDPAYVPTISLTTRDLKGEVEITLKDNGTGMPPEIKDKIFQPFFTTKPAGEGTGLGLSISYDIVVQAHKGRFEVESEPGEFTLFRITVPREGQSVDITTK